VSGVHAHKILRELVRKQMQARRRTQCHYFSGAVNQGPLANNFASFPLTLKFLVMLLTRAGNRMYSDHFLPRISPTTLSFASLRSGLWIRITAMCATNPNLWI
jgi:hypothetical protein